MTSFCYCLVLKSCPTLESPSASSVLGISQARILKWVPISCGSCCCSVAQSCLTLCDPMECSTPGFPVLHHHPQFAQIHVHWVQWCHPAISSSHHLLLLPSVFASIRVFSSESALPIRWPMYWSFSFNISPSSEYPGLISFRIDWLDLLAVQGTFMSLF